MKKILIVGDSFVTERIPNRKDNTITYADWVHREYDNVKAVGIPGGGNDIISSTVISYFQDYQTIIVNWTSSCRYDILLTDKKLIKLFNKSATANKVIDNNFWLLSGGWRGFWSRESSKDIFEALYKYHFNIEDSWRRTLKNLLMVQRFLYNSNKNQIHFFSYDTFENLSFGEYEKLFQKERKYNSNKWKTFLQKHKWTNQIDWNTVWFHKNAYSNTGGIMDWCHDNTTDIGHHPANEGHEQFYQSIIKPWLDQHN